MCHTIFHTKLNSSDLKLFYVLIAMCSLKYNKTTYTTFSLKIKDIKEQLGDDASIKNQLKKLNAMKMTINFFRSYTIDKDIPTKRRNITPFVIDFGTAKRVNEITITVDKDFIDYFEEHNFKTKKGKFSLSYRYLNNIDNIQYQLLYMYLADRVGNEKDVVNKYIDIKDLALLMNRQRSRELEDVVDDIRKAKARFEEIDIDIKFEYDIEKELIPNKDEEYETHFEIKFMITRTKEQPRYIPAPKTSKKFVQKTKYDVGLSDDEIDLANKLIVNIVDFHTERYRKNNIIQSKAAVRKKIKNDNKLEANKSNILWINNLLTEGVKAVESDDANEINEGAENILMLVDEQRNYYLIGNSYLIYSNSGEELKSTIEETVEFIKSKSFEAHYTTNPEKNFRVSRLNKATFFDEEIEKMKQKQKREATKSNDTTLVEEKIIELEKEQLNNIESNVVKGITKNNDIEDNYQGIRDIIKNRITRKK